MTGSLRLKSLSDPVSPEDGTRILVTRWQPRHKKPWWDEWQRVLAPSEGLLAWAKARMGADPQGTWQMYHLRFIQEMTACMPWSEILDLRRRIASGETITLLCYCKTEYCHRYLLRDLIIGEEP